MYNLAIVTMARLSKIFKNPGLFAQCLEYGNLGPKILIPAKYSNLLAPKFAHYYFNMNYKEFA